MNNEILMPDIDAVDLTALTKSHCDLTYLDGDYAEWNFYVDVDGRPISGRGKRFECMTWTPGRDTKSDEVRVYFKKRGFYGHAGAFTAWVKERKPQGYHASLPENNGCCRDSEEGFFCPPFSYFGSNDRKLALNRAGIRWENVWVFIAFREL